VPTLRFTTDIGAAVEACFDLSRSIDLHLESMLASRERAVGGVTSGLIGAAPSPRSATSTGSRPRVRVTR